MKILNRYIFDLDNTLIYTDSLNNDAYNYALNLQVLAPIYDFKRITRDIIFDKYSNMNNIQKNKIIELKQKYFMNNLNKTIQNPTVLKVLESKNIEFCMLWTSADKNRVMALLKYYNISFRKILFSKKINVLCDVKTICKSLECDLNELVFYEDDPRIINDLQKLKLKVIPVIRPSTSETVI